MTPPDEGLGMTIACCKASVGDKCIWIAVEGTAEDEDEAAVGGAVETAE